MREGYCELLLLHWVVEFNRVRSPNHRVRDRQRHREKRELSRRSRLLWCNKKLFAGDPRLHLRVVIEDQGLGA
jgi:hypothetical protein